MVIAFRLKDKDTPVLVRLYNILGTRELDYIRQKFNFAVHAHKKAYNKVKISDILSQVLEGYNFEYVSVDYDITYGEF